jgi:hypothetical protein
LEHDLHSCKAEPTRVLEDRCIVLAGMSEDRVDDSRPKAAITFAHRSLEWRAAAAAHETAIGISTASFSTRSGDGASSPAHIATTPFAA